MMNARAPPLAPCAPPPPPPRATAEPAFLWTRLRTSGDHPHPVSCLSACVYQERYIITFGGASSLTPNGDVALQCSNDVHCLDLNTHRWRRIEARNAEIVQPRIAHSAVIYKDTMLVYGGSSLTRNPVSLNELLALDLHAWTWRLVQTVPSDPEGPGERFMHTATVYKDRMYVLMGAPCPTPASLWYLDLINFSWHAVPRSASLCAPHLPLTGHSACVHEDMLYVFGGECRPELSGQGIAAGPELSVVSYSNTLYRYDFLTNAWSMPATLGSDAPPGRYACAMGILDGRLFLFGGDSDGCRVFYDDFWMFDTTQPRGRWVEIARRMRHGPADRQRPSHRTGAAAVVTRGALYVVSGELGPANPDEDDEQYTNEVFRCPLTISLEAPLEDSAARWLSRSSANTMAAATLYPSLPASARALLSSYLPNSDTVCRLSGPPPSDNEVSVSGEEAMGAACGRRGSAEVDLGLGEAGRPVLVRENKESDPPPPPSQWHTLSFGL